MDSEWQGGPHDKCHAIAARPISGAGQLMLIADKWSASVWSLRNGNNLLTRNEAYPLPHLGKRSQSRAKLCLLHPITSLSLDVSKTRC